MIAIHDSKESFSERWIKYCEDNNIPFKTVNCYSNTIIEELKNCDALLWHHNHAFPKDQLFAKQLLFSLEQSGKVVFPNFNTSWHFDDKLAQKYLFEANNIKCVKTYVFYQKEDALRWIRNTTMPKVLKLRRGAGSGNVFLVKNYSQGRKAINKAFGKGFRLYNSIGGLKEAIRKFLIRKNRIVDVLKAAAHLIYPIKIELAIGRERGYVLFQDFIPDNTFDIRVIVIDNKAFAIKRMVRPNDFRASGSGLIEYEKHHFKDTLIAHSFNVADCLKSSCLAIDYVFDGETPLIVEVSYGFAKKGYDPCLGYWDKDLNWHKGAFNPYGWMIDGVIRKIKKQFNE